MFRKSLLIAGLVTVALALPVLAGGRYLSGLIWPEPAVVTPGTNGSAPSDAIVLFDGKNFDAWKGGEKWKVDDDGGFTVKGVLETKQAFGDIQLHVEWASPNPPKGKDQGRGNNGIGLMGARYEIQVLDSYQNKTYFEGQAGSVYNQRPPMVNACRKPGEWQTYDIIWTAPRFAADGKLQKPAYVTVLHNGVLVQNHTELIGDTPFNRAPKYEKHADKLPLVLMYHGDPVRFRNIWVREFKELEPKKSK
ncbi:MAG TPA: DUF1080 domain-containing protein [Gemmataceae bacterium]|nr:DUF1080 domain-containing protein [Gemmataceae bacterium]